MRKEAQEPIRADGSPIVAYVSLGEGVGIVGPPPFLENIIETIGPRIPWHMLPPGIGSGGGKLSILGEMLLQIWENHDFLN